MPTPNDPLSEYRTQASLLLKALRNGDLSAAARFQRLTPFRGSTPDQIIARGDGVQRKHALDVIARENGRLDWKRLKDAHDTLWSAGGFFNNWFPTYEAAKDVHREAGGFLLPCKGMYILVEAGYIEALGLDPQDPRWQAIGFDAVRPAAPAALESLVADMRERKSPA